MSACILDISAGHLFVHRNDNLFAGRALSSHVDARLRFTFTITAVNDFLDLVNFVILEFGEHFLDFKSVHH